MRRPPDYSTNQLILLAIFSLAWPMPTAHSATNEVSLPLTERRDLYYLAACAQGTNAALLLLDTGFEMTMIHPARAEEWKLERSGRVTIAGTR